MNLTDVLTEAGVFFCRAGEHHHVREGWVGVDCPWCPAPRGYKGKYRLGIELTTGRANCWVCGRHSLPSVLVEAGKISYQAASALLTGVKLARFIPKPHQIGKLVKPKGIAPMAVPHKQYLEERGFDPEEIERLWNVQGIGLAANLQWRLFIPIHLDGKEISWTTRSISSTNPRRYVTAAPSQESLHFKDSLYGLDLVRTTILVVEGPTDVWNIGPGAAGTYGLLYTPAQVSIIAKFPWRVVCFDNAPDAQKRARALCDTLSLFPGRTTNICLDAEDPGSASKKEIQRLRATVLD